METRLLHSVRDTVVGLDTLLRRFSGIHDSVTGPIILLFVNESPPSGFFSAHCFLKFICDTTGAAPKLHMSTVFFKNSDMPIESLELITYAVASGTAAPVYDAVKDFTDLISNQGREWQMAKFENAIFDPFVLDAYARLGYDRIAICFDAQSTMCDLDVQDLAATKPILVRILQRFEERYASISGVVVRTL